MSTMSTTTSTATATTAAAAAASFSRRHKRSKQKSSSSFPASTGTDESALLQKNKAAQPTHEAAAVAGESMSNNSNSNSNNNNNLLEYSDTSGDDEDSNNNNNNHHRRRRQHHQQRHHHHTIRHQDTINDANCNSTSSTTTAVKSSFRPLDDSLNHASKIMQRVVNMSQPSPGVENNDDDDDDDDDDDEENQPTHAGGGGSRSITAEVLAKHYPTLQQKQQQQAAATTTTTTTAPAPGFYHAFPATPSSSSLPPAPPPIGGGGVFGMYASSSYATPLSSHHHPAPGNWVEKLAFSFRSPLVTGHHKRVSSSNLIEYPHSSYTTSRSVSPRKRRTRPGEAHDDDDDDDDDEYDGNEYGGGDECYDMAMLHNAQRHLPHPLLKDRSAAGAAGAAGAAADGGGSGNRNLAVPSGADPPAVDAFVGPAREKTPLLEKKKPPSPTDDTKQQQQQQQQRAVHIAAAFLNDYEANRPPSLPTTLTDITPHQLRLHQWKFTGYVFPTLVLSATVALFLSSALEGFIVPQGQRILLTGLNLYGIVVFAVDLWIRLELRGGRTNSKANKNKNSYNNNNNSDHTSSHISAAGYFLAAASHVNARDSRSGRLIKPLILFGTVLACENVTRLIWTQNSLVLFSSLFKPLILFYVSYQARNAFSAFRRIIRIVLRVLAMEALLILMFAAVACRLFGGYAPFANLSTSWLSLFELSTTVVNPSIWMPIYRASKVSALFFVFYIVTTVFYLHSLVLSVVFQTYIHAASEIHERSVGDREDAIHLAYLSLLQPEQQQRMHHFNLVDMHFIRDVLQRVRPHYNAFKINALVEIVDPSNQGYVDYPTFRTKIRAALNASVRTARNASPLAMAVELIAVLVAVVNFFYVIMVSSEFNAEWFSRSEALLGCFITALATLELAVRFNPCRLADFTPLTRLSATFDGLALLAAFTSSVGIVLYLIGQPHALEFMLMGRAIDMIRILRFFRIFRDVVRRSADVLPVLTGPIVLVVTTMHIFVYLGMALWGGYVRVGEHRNEITPLYDLNNFNSYEQGAVTMFQVLVVNDWHAIAEVFLYAHRCNSPYIVYPFFVFGNLIGVSIMLNVLTAFFVESFVTKINDDSDGKMQAAPLATRERDVTIPHSETNSVRRLSSGSLLQMVAGEEGGTPRSDEGDQLHESGYHDDGEPEWEASSNDFFEFDVFEREGVDKIMQTVVGSYGHGDIARSICDYLEVFENLTSGREQVGYLVCDQQTLDRFGNERFRKQAKGYLKENELHMVVSEMHAELLALSSRASNADRSLVRQFSKSNSQDDKLLEISACLLRLHPALSLFISRYTTSQQQSDPLSSTSATAALPP